MDEEAVNIKIKSMDGTSFGVKIKLNSSVSTLKQMIFNLRELEVERQRIIYRGRVLRDTDILSGHGLEEGHTIHLVPRPIGVPPSPMIQSNSSNTNTPDLSLPGSRGTSNATSSLLAQALGRRMQQSGIGSGGGTRTGGGVVTGLQAALLGALSGGRSQNRDHPLNEGIPDGRQLEHLHQGIMTMNTLVSTMNLDSSLASEMIEASSRRREQYPFEFFENTVEEREEKEETKVETKESESKFQRNVRTSPIQQQQQMQEEPRTPAILRTGSSGLEEDLLKPKTSTSEDNKSGEKYPPTSSPTNSPTSSPTSSSNRDNGLSCSPRLYNGQWLDVLDTVNQWLEATVIDTDDNRVYVHYNGWPSRWDEWLDVSSPRVAPFRTWTVHSSATPNTSPSPVSYMNTSLAPVVGVNDIRYVLPRVDALLHSVLPLFNRVAQLGVEQKSHERKEGERKKEQEKEKEHEQ
jgi:hypothetical protein